MDIFYERDRIGELERSLTYESLCEYIELLKEEYEKINVFNIGYSILGRRLHSLSLGNGKKVRLYVATHHAMEWPTSVVLLRFISDICSRLNEEGETFSKELKNFLEENRIIFIPMLNPDGVELQINGAKEGEILYERQIKMNKGCKDFSLWQANARGVDLNHNYNAGFYEYKRIEKELEIDGPCATRYSGEHPESEPEVSALCNLIRALEVERIYTLHTQGEEIFYTSGDKELKKSLEIGRELERLSGYKLSRPEGAAAYGGLIDWAITKKDIPSFTIECGLGKNPLPPSDAKGIYEKIRDMLFYSLTA